MICLRQELSENEAVKKLLPAVIRSISGDKREGYLRYIISRLAQHIAFTQSGLWLGKQPTIKIDLKRFHSTLERIVLGLYYFTNNIALDSGYEVKCYTLEYVESLPKDKFELLKKVLIEPLQGNKFVYIGEAIFKYRFARSHDKNATAWQLTFYEKYLNFCVTVRRGNIREQQYSDYDYPPIWHE